MLFVSRTCFNEFLSLLDVAWVNKVLYCIVSAKKNNSYKKYQTALWCLLMMNVMLYVQVSGKSYEFFMDMPRIAVPFKYKLSFTKMDFLLDTWWHRLIFVCKANKWFGKSFPDRNSNTARWRGNNTFPANSWKTLCGHRMAAQSQRGLCAPVRH